MFIGTAEHFRSPHCLLSLEVLLPHKEEYTPPLNIRVVDNRKFGRRPIVGVHSITTLRPFMHDPPRPEATWRAEIEAMRAAQAAAFAATRAAEVAIQIEGVFF